MELKVVTFIFGCILLSVGMFGGGIQLKEVVIPKVGRIARFIATLLGAFFILIGFGLEGADMPPPYTASPQPSWTSSQQPTSALGWYEEANRLYSAERYREAISAYDQVIGSNDDSRNVCIACTWAKRGHSLEMLKDYEHAVLSYEQALRHDPNISWVQENLARLRQNDSQLAISSNDRGDVAFTLINETSRPLERFFASPSNIDDWEEDILGEHILQPGERSRITISDGRQDCTYDFLATIGPASDGSIGRGDMIQTSINICNLSEWGFSEN